LPLSSAFLAHRGWRPPVLSVFTDFLYWLSWLSRIFIKKAPSGAGKSIGASKSVFFDQKWLRFSNPPPEAGFHIPGIASSSDFRLGPIAHESNKTFFIIT
jgi:hypothetical protein